MGHHRKSQALTPLSRPVACFYGNQQLLWGEFCITGFPGGSDSKESACNAGEQESIPGLGRCPGEENGYAFQYSCLKNPRDEGAWWAATYGVTQSQTQLK